MIDASGERFVLAPWDWQLYAERLRKAEYDLDESQIKPYFELDRVLRDGVFFAANRLYGIELVEREGIPVYHPDVRVFDVLDADGSPLALFYADFFKRDNKSRRRVDGHVRRPVAAARIRRAIVYNVTNFTKPAPGQPALLSFDDVSTLFHEFGHALHGMLSDVEYPMLSGANVPRDFVEFPSQFNEHWALDETVFARYARHHLTDEPMPAALVERIERSRDVQSGIRAHRVRVGRAPRHGVAPSASRKPGPRTSTRSSATYCASTVWRCPRFRRATIRRTSRTRGMAATVPATTRISGPRCWITTHTPGSRTHGGLSREAGQRFREMVLSRGGTADPAELYRAFLGRDPRVEPLLAFRGFTSAET